MKRPLTEHERMVLTGALRTAVKAYRDLSATPGVISAGLVEEFEQRAYDADYLAGMLEEVAVITIDNEELAS